MFDGGLDEMMLRLDVLRKRDDEIFLDEGFRVHLIGLDDVPK